MIEFNCSKTEKHFYPGKPYSEYPVLIKQNLSKMKSAEGRFRNVGPINISRKSSENNFESSQRMGRAASIRKMAKNYQKQLQKRYNNLRINNVRSEKNSLANH